MRNLEVHTKINVVIILYLFLVEEQRSHCIVKDFLLKKGAEREEFLFLKKLFVVSGLYSVGLSNFG